MEYDAGNFSLLAYQEIVTHYLRRLAGTSEQVFLATLTRNQRLVVK